MTCSHEGGHVEAAADGTPTAKDRAFASSGTAVAVEGGQSSQSGCLAAIEFSQFGHLRQEQRSGAWPDSRDGGELACIGGECFRLLDPLLATHSDLGDLLFD